MSSNLVLHTVRELELLDGNNHVSPSIRGAVLQLIRCLSRQGGSGGSVFAVLSIIQNGGVKELAHLYEHEQGDALLSEAHDALSAEVVELVDLLKGFNLSKDDYEQVMKMFLLAAQFRPLSPLLGDDLEWELVADGIYQNKRCSCVFINHGLAENIDAVVFVEPSGVQFTAWPSRQPVRFPYTWHQDFVHLDANDNAINPKFQHHTDALRSWREHRDDAECEFVVHKNLVN